MSAAILQVNDLSVVAHNLKGDVTLVDRVSFDLHQGEILGLVGESGSGKTMVCRALMRLMPSTDLQVQGGSVLLDGIDLLSLNAAAMFAVRGGKMGMIFQNPSSHLDPLMRIGDQISEGFRLHQGASKREARAQSIDVLRQVGIPDPKSRIDNYPHEFSGGMRQRAMIAVALGCDPQVLIADEPTTALDVTVQAQILRLLLDLRDRRGLSLIMITHDLGVVAQTCDSIAVMYAGRLCEHGAKRDVLIKPRHPYTAGLIECQPAGSAGQARLKTIAGQPPLLDALPAGCRFHNRCNRAQEGCAEQLPQMHLIGASQQVSCHHPLPVNQTRLVGVQS
jgi:peptide/nickel transport system ATP-binding protein